MTNFGYLEVDDLHTYLSSAAQSRHPRLLYAHSEIDFELYIEV